MSEDRHKTRLISKVLAIIVSALFAAFGVAGYQRTGDLTQLMVFIGLSVLAYVIVVFIFKGIDRLLDSIDDR
ncbi:hypothetical protein [Neptunomonas concharum]|uniref:Uncharacterized protein n=1 Tax=Neptunomonas concharum TaxID=1031538 RepID=A0A5P1RA04_9GAMM|nr:hypothetical protein [Neptunomonas concharum]QEQ96427.1 hypothetical protein F0U83_06755 [Neptunomonas concharum]